jgi:hypothetical protein
LIITKSGLQVYPTTMVLTYQHNKSRCHHTTARSPSHEGLVYTTSSIYTCNHKFLSPIYNQNVHQHNVITITMPPTDYSSTSLRMSLTRGSCVVVPCQQIWYSLGLVVDKVANTIRDSLVKPTMSMNASYMLGFMLLGAHSSQWQICC